MAELTELSVVAMAEALRSRRITAVDLLEAHLGRIAAVNPTLNAVLDLDADGARVAARDSDSRRARDNSLGPLDGIPVGVKDNMDMAGRPTTAGLGTAWTAETDSEVVARLRAAGAVIVAKLAMDEAALGASGDNPHHGRIDNPAMPGRSPAGSSGGSAAAVASGMLPLALGSDTLGSVRLPASYCGIVGWKPSFDRIPTEGLTLLSHTLDHVGLLARHTADVALAAPYLAATVPEPVDLDGLTLGRVVDLDISALQPAVAAATEAAIGRLRDAGARIEPVTLGLGDLSALRRAALLMIEAEGAVSLEDIWTRTPEALSDGLRAMLSYGRDAPAQRFVKASWRVEAAGAALNDALDGIDALVLPTAPQVAYPAGQPAPMSQADLTGPANMGGAPAISLPCGTDADGAPIGLQLIGGFYEDERLLGIALAVEKTLN